MPSFSDLITTLVENVVYDVVKNWLFIFIALAASNALLAVVFQKIKTKKEIIAWWGCGFVLMLAVMQLLGTKSQEPNLGGNIQQIQAGGINNDQDTVAIITVNIMNAGNMQSIIKNWNVEAEVNGNKYSGTFTVMPDTFFFSEPRSSDPSNPTKIIYKKEDDILDKSINPIQSGGSMPGILFVVFPRIPPETFKYGAKFIVSYEDILSKKYTLEISSTAQTTPNVMATPGLHTGAVCPVPALH